MDSTFGIAGKDWVIVACDSHVVRSIMHLKHDEDKVTELSKFKVVGCSGEQPDRAQFTGYIKANLALQEFRTGHELSVEATARYMRTEMAQALRRAPHQVNMMIGGYDQLEGRAKLYWMDYLGTLQQVNKGAQGYAGYFINSVLDNHFKHDMTLEEGFEACRKCIQELKTRFLVRQDSFTIKVVTKDGVRKVEL